MSHTEFDARPRRPTDVVNRHWPALDAEELAGLRGHWPQLAGMRGIRWHSPRPFAAAALVDTACGSCFVKRHARAVRSAAELLEEHRFIDWLQARGVPVIRPVPAADGSTAVTLGERTYEVLPLAAGLDLYREHSSWEPFLALGHARSAGSMLARLHAAAGEYRAPARCAQRLLASFELFGPRPLSASLDAFVGRRPALAQYVARHDGHRALLATLAPWHAAWCERPAPAALWAHNDWHPSNLLWSAQAPEATVCSVLDFGLSNRTSALFDLATAIERSAIPWLDIQSGLAGAADLEAVSALLEGYESVRRLTAAEAAGLSRILPLVHVEFALSEVDYYHGTVHDPEYADLAWEAFLIGHVRWFASAAGRVLREFLDARAGAAPGS